MPFTVGQYLTANDLKSQEDAHTLGYGVVNGLKVIPDAPPSMDIDVEVGKCYAADTVVVKGAVTTLTVTAADPANPRKDIVVCNSVGTLSIVAGTPEAALPGANVGVYTLEPEPPSIPANSIILAEIWVPAGAAAITGAEIYDKRVSIADFLTHKDAATGVHGVGAGTVAKVGDIAVDANLSAAAQDAVAKKHAQNTDTDLSPAHKDAATGVHGVGASTVCSEAEADTKIAARVPSGLIVMWHGTIASIPSGWVICDGLNSTPDLLTKFVEGVATALTDPGATGGEATHTLIEAEIPAHKHKIRSYTIPGGSYADCQDASRSAVPDTYNTSSIGGSGAHENEPPFYDVAFLMKT